MTDAGVPLAVNALLASLATWRLAFMLTQEDGPWDVFVRLRVAAGASLPGRILQCFYCTSVWVAAPLTGFVTSWSPRAVVVWLAISGAACLLHRATDRGLEIIPLGPRPPASETRFDDRHQE